MKSVIFIASACQTLGYILYVNHLFNPYKKSMIKFDCAYFTNDTIESLFRQLAYSH